MIGAQTAQTIRFKNCTRYHAVRYAIFRYRVFSSPPYMKRQTALTKLSEVEKKRARHPNYIDDGFGGDSVVLASSAKTLPLGSRALKLKEH